MRTTALLLLAAVALAGCSSLTAQQQQDTPDVVQVEGPTCTVNGEPCSSTTLTRHDTAKIRLSVAYQGETVSDSKPLTITKGGNKQQSIIVSRCNTGIAKVTGFTAERQSSKGVNDVSNKDAVALEAGQRLRMSWTVDIKRGVSELGYSCPLGFELNFDQTIETARQIQVKANPDVADVASLSTRTTSRRPVRLRIDAPDSVIAGRSTTVRAYLQNTGKGEVTGVTRINSIGNIVSSCSDDKLRMYGAGRRAGESYRLTCPWTPSLSNTDSAIKWLKFRGKYSYELPLRTITLRIRPAPGGGK